MKVPSAPPEPISAPLPPMSAYPPPPMSAYPPPPAYPGTYAPIKLKKRKIVCGLIDARVSFLFWHLALIRAIISARSLCFILPWNHVFIPLPFYSLPWRCGAFDRLLRVSLRILSKGQVSLSSSYLLSCKFFNTKYLKKLITISYCLHLCHQKTV